MKKGLILLLALVCQTALCQVLQPIEIANKLFSKQWAELPDRHFTGEFSGHPNYADLFAGNTASIALLNQTDTKAVVAVTIKDSTGTGLDAYLHFEKDTIWKINAFRALAMTGILQQLKAFMDTIKPEQVDSIIKTKNKKNKKMVGFSSVEEFNFQKGNVALTLDLDDNIIAHFTKNKAEFIRLRDIALKEAAAKKDSLELGVGLCKSNEADYKKLFISSISAGGYELGDGINFLIGGMIDNNVGYLYVTDKKQLPEMNPSRVIMLREIGEGWYIYKTT